MAQAVCLAWQGPREHPETIANWKFIAHAREDVPALVAEVRRLRYLITSDEHDKWAKIFRENEANKLEVERLRAENDELKKSQGYSPRPHWESHWNLGSQEKV